MSEQELRQLIHDALEQAGASDDVEYDSSGLSLPGSQLQRLLDRVMDGVESYGEHRYNNGFADGEYFMAKPL